MFTEKKLNSRTERYEELEMSVRYTLADETDIICGLSMASAIINVYIDSINWVGFYILKNGELVLGPFQGLPACIRIAVGKGVCGTAAKEGRTVIVKDVNEFPGHIACDVCSNSEIVIPIFTNGELYGVLDIDSHEIGRFDQEEAKCLEAVARDIGEFVRRCL
ncbi:MAG: GAF domain-containing protein [Clostridiales bacterium]|jgi:GAF domain-containing protein|nr:GAF domain-containing protein [Clostridiales bacterium]